MAKIRVLIVDDAVVFRRLLSEELAKDPALEVAATAANGRIALERMTQVNPDLVILDVEMPEMDGLATLKELRKSYPRLPIIMFSALTQRGAEATLNALFFGATDYFTKPDNAGSVGASLEVIRSQLVPAIKALCGKSERETKNAGPGDVAERPSGISRRPAFLATRPPPAPVQIVAIGASTGGPNALTDVFARIPADFPVPIVVVQHMPPMFTRLFAERLSAQTLVRVAEGDSGSVLRPGHAWIAPGDYHLVLTREGRQVLTRIHQDPPENSCRPSVDVLFRSVAQLFGASALAVILTGMGQDGLRGSTAVYEAGGQVLAQDEATSVVWGMPGYVAKAGIADRVLPLSLIGDEIVRRVCHDRS